MAVLKQSLASLFVLSLGLASVSQAIEPREILMLRTKAVQGNAVAQYNLARAFADPTSPNRDPAEAYVWFQIASENGAQGDELSKLVGTMSPAELIDAKRRLEERRAQLIASKASSAEAPAADADPTRLASELSEARAAARELALRNQQLEDVASERGRALQSALAEVNKLKESGAQAASPDSQLVSMTAERDLLTKQLNEAQEQLRKLKGLPERVTRAERDVELLRSQNASLTTQLKTAQQAAVGLAPSAPSVATDDSKALQERLDRAERTVAQLNKKNLELADLAQRAYSAESESARVQAKLTEVQKTSDEFKARAEAAEAKVAAQPTGQAESEDLKKELADTREKLEASLRSYTLLQQELAQAKSGQQTADVGVSAPELASLREKAEALEKQNASLAEQLSEAQAKVATSDVATATQKELDETKDKLNTALRSYALLQKEFDETKERLATAETDTASLRAQLTSAIADTQDRVKALNAIEQEIAQLRGASISQNKETLSLQDQLRQSMAQSAALAEENAQLKTRIALLAPPPASTLATPLRPNTAAAQAAITLPVALGGQSQTEAASPSAGPRSHIIAPGDSLGKIARRYYGSSERWNEIYRANRNILSDPNKLPIGASLRIP